MNHVYQVSRKNVSPRQRPVINEHALCVLHAHQMGMDTQLEVVMVGLTNAPCVQCVHEEESN